MVLWENVSSHKATWKFLPEYFRFQGRNTKNGTSGEKEVWFIPGHEFSALIHILLIWAVRALSSEVSGIPSGVLALEGLWEDRYGETPNSSEFLAVSQMSPLLSCWGGSQSLSSPNKTCNSLWSHSNGLYLSVS